MIYAVIPKLQDTALYQLLREVLVKAIDGTRVPLLVDETNQRVYIGTSTASTTNAGTLEVGTGDVKTQTAGKGLIVKTPDGTKEYRIRVDNDGALVAELLLAFLFFFPSPASANRAIMEGIAASSTTVFVDTTNARVGIGLTNPAARLDINHNLSPALQIGTTFYVGNGRIGVGTTSPQAQLHVLRMSPQPNTDVLVDASGSGNAYTTLLADAGNAGFTINSGGGAQAFIHFLRNSSYLWTVQVYGAEDRLDIGSYAGGYTSRMSLGQDGKIGMGTTAPVQNLQVLSGTTDTGKLGVGDATHAACVMLGDTDKAGCTECFALNGTFSCTTDADCVCDGS